MIPIERIEEVWDEVFDSTPEEAEILTSQFNLEEPMAVEYLIDRGKEDFNEKEQELLLFIGMAIWMVYQRFCRALVKIDKNELLNAENLEMKSAIKFEGNYFDEVLVNHHQKDMLQVILNTIIEKFEEENSGIREDNTSLLFLYHKILVDCFDQACLKK